MYVQGEGLGKLPKWLTPPKSIRKAVAEVFGAGVDAAKQTAIARIQATQPQPTFMERAQDHIPLLIGAGVLALLLLRKR